MLKRLN